MMMAAAKPIEHYHFEKPAEWLDYLATLSLAKRREVLKQKGRLNTAEAALYLDMARQTLYNLVNAEQGPEHEKLGEGRGARTIFYVEALDRWDKSRTVRKGAFRK